jgi:hypothetical protein
MRDSDVQREIDNMITTRIVTDSNGRKHITTEPLLHPPKRTWVGLTDDERGGILVTYCEAGLWRLSEAIEAKLKEKNT